MPLKSGSTVLILRIEMWYCSYKENMHCHHLGSFPGLPSFWFAFTQDSIQNIWYVRLSRQPWRSHFVCISPTNEAWLIRWFTQISLVCQTVPTAVPTATPWKKLVHMLQHHSTKRWTLACYNNSSFSKFTQEPMQTSGMTDCCNSCTFVYQHFTRQQIGLDQIW